MWREREGCWSAPWREREGCWSAPWREREGCWSEECALFVRVLAEEGTACVSLRLSAHCDRMQGGDDIGDGVTLYDCASYLHPTQWSIQILISSYSFYCLHACGLQSL